jgi:hypothetical protein
MVELYSFIFLLKFDFKYLILIYKNKLILINLDEYYKLLEEKQKRKAYLRQYYLNNRHKYKKIGPDLRGHRGKAKKLRYQLTYLEETKLFASVNEIAQYLELKDSVVRGIILNKYINSRKKHCKEYQKYKIIKLM